MILDIIEQSIHNLFRANIRTFLTLLGVVIGIAAIVSLLSIGAGLNVAVEKQFEQLGANTIFVIAGNPLGGSFTQVDITQADVDSIQAISGVSEAVPIYTSAGVMEADGEKLNISILAADPDKAAIFESIGFFDMREGRKPTKNESGGVVISEALADTAFSRPLSVRKTVLINGQEFKIIGIQKKQQQALGDSNPTNMVLLSLDGYARVTDDTHPLEIVIKTVSTDNVKDITDKIQKLLEKKYGEKSVYVYSSDQILEQVNQIYSLITIFLVGISLISLIVGGVGIMNAMITAVMERTREIGVMKALGASNTLILIMVLIEAALIGLVGGGIGVIVGYGLAKIVAFVGIQAGFLLEAVISWDITLGALGFSMLVGMLSGFLPARRAANLDPIEALRYE